MLYQRFADDEARGISPRYEAFARTVARHAGVHQFLLSLPVAKRQPNLLFASVRLHHGVAASGHEFCEQLLDSADLIAATMRSRSTQTNEPARCAVLLPLLSSLPQPIALLELGASAGLCLYPDRYGYRYNGGDLLTADSAANRPVFDCKASPNTPIPACLPEVVWRAGVDLNPLDVTATDTLEWLRTLIWPEQQYRCDNLQRAVKLLRRTKPVLVQGDILHGVDELISDAPGDATLVIFHSAVLAYVADTVVRQAFAENMMAHDAVWISNEHPAVFPAIVDRLGFSPPADRFLLSINGTAVAATGPHGQSIDWF